MLGLGIGLHKNNFVGGGVSYDATYQAILDYATAQGYTLPTDLQKAKENQLMIDLKASNIWSKLDTFANFATDGDSNFALIDWKRLIQYTPVNSPIFTANQGFTGNGVSSYIDSNYNAFSQAVNFQLNNAMAGAYIRTSPISPIGTKAVYGNGNTDSITLLPQGNSAAASFRLNNSTAGGLSSTNQLGLWLVNRASSSFLECYKENSYIAVTRPSTNIINRNIHLFKNNDSINPYWWGGQISFFYAGSSINEIAYKSLKASIENYFNGNLGGKLSVFFGDSITFGVGATTPSNRWTSVLNTLQGGIEQNYGISGSMMVPDPLQVGNSMYERQNLIPNYSFGINNYLFFSYGANDSRIPTEPVESFKSRYNEVLQTAFSRGWSKDKIKITNIYRPPTATVDLLNKTAQFNQAIQEICNDNNIQLFDIASILNISDLADDIHPNDGGYLKMANYINSNIL